ncbi:MAG: SDR family oxidoreductase [Desulfobacterales bacterium]|jgi:NAD(P)-dependent dehydrogenase (short-subunit alcohol dehydrogenase family)|nr:SDR family oxidoreductase [Desulfobacteraceae bacterium]MBT7696186.1 SDR family oxidoreductase [Desulfobacterales bacterium]
MKDFENYVVLVTGGGSGIGQKTTELFVNEGAEVIIADLNREAIDDTIKSIGKKVSGKVCDVTNSKDIIELKNFVQEKYGKIDVLVNNAGKVLHGTLEELKEEEWDSTMNVLLKGPFLVTKHLLPLLKKSDHPSIVNVSSVTSIVNWPRNMVYGSSKAGLNKLGEQITRDFPWLRCNTIQPGIIDTPIYGFYASEQEKKERFEKYTGLIPAGYIGKTEDVGHCILFLSSKKASYIHGAEIIIDGGFSKNWLPDL